MGNGNGNWGSRGCLLGLAIATSACGPGVREFLLGPTRTPAPTATPAAAPVAAATPEPTPSPVAPNPGPLEGGEDIPQNGAAVVRVGARVFFVECGGVEVPGSEDATVAQVGCRLHMDSTARDAANQPTRAQGTPYWHLSDPGLVSGPRIDYTPAFTIRNTGDLALSMEVDGVRSNEVVVRFIDGPIPD